MNRTFITGNCAKDIPMDKISVVPVLSVYSELQIKFAHGLDNMDGKGRKRTVSLLRVREFFYS